MKKTYKITVIILFFLGLILQVIVLQYDKDNKYDYIFLSINGITGLLVATVSWLPNYSRSKMIAWMYHTKFFGTYSDLDISYRTNIKGKIVEGRKEKVTIEIKEQNGKVKIFQQSSSAKNIDSELLRAEIGKDTSKLWFKYYTLHSDKSDSHNGVQYIEVDHTHKKVINSYYYNNKPGFGSYQKNKDTH